MISCNFRTLKPIFSIYRCYKSMLCQDKMAIKTCVQCYIVTSPPIGGGRGIVMPMSVSVFVCLFVCVFVCLCVCLSVFSQNFKV